MRRTLVKRAGEIGLLTGWVSWVGSLLADCLVLKLVKQQDLPQTTCGRGLTKVGGTLWELQMWDGFHYLRLLSWKRMEEVRLVLKEHQRS